jgi:hypothetical protein
VCIPYGIKVAYPESGFTRLDIRVNPQKERLRVVAAIKFVYTLFPDHAWQASAARLAWISALASQGDRAFAAPQ